MNVLTINNLDPIIRVTYFPNGKLKSFLTLDSANKRYRLYSKNSHNVWGKSFSQLELDEINELLGSPIGKIDLEELEKF